MTLREADGYAESHTEINGKGVVGGWGGRRGTRREGGGGATLVVVDKLGSRYNPTPIGVTGKQKSLADGKVRGKKKKNAKRIGNDARSKSV